MITVCFQYLFLAKWKKQSWLSRVVILLTHDGYAVENTVNFLSNCILYFPQCQLYWMIVRFTLGFHLFFIKIISLAKGNNQNPISINRTSTGPQWMLFVSFSGSSCISLSRSTWGHACEISLNIKRVSSCQNCSPNSM